MAKRTRGLPEGVYPYDTAVGRRYRCAWRDSKGTPQGKRGFRDPQEAARYRRAKMAAADRGELVGSKDTLAAYAGDEHRGWLHDHRATVEPGTWEDYERHVRLRIANPAYGLGDKKLTKIDPADVRAFRARMSEGTADRRALAPKTVNNCLRVLALIFDQAVADGHLARNPATTQGRAKLMLALPHAEMDYLRRAEIRPYLEACAPWYRPVAEILVFTGMRVSEVCALEVEDVQPAERAIRVNRSRKRAGIGSTKGDRMHRVEVGAGLIDTLQWHIARDGEHRAMDRHAPLFVRPDLGRRWDRHAGEPLSRYVVSEWHADALEAAGLRHLRVHDLRHTAAALWLSLGEPLTFVQRQLGHAHHATTQRVYGHLEAGTLSEAASRAEAAVFG